MREERYRAFLDQNFNEFMDRRKKGKTPLELAQETAGSAMVGKDLAAAEKQFKYVIILTFYSFEKKRLSFLPTFLVRSTWYIVHSTWYIERRKWYVLHS